MKDTIITSKRKQLELKTLLACFIIMNSINIYSIYTFNTSWTEVIMSLGYVTIGSFALYIIWTILRLFLFGSKHILETFKKNSRICNKASDSK